jgi:hypothetical protein
MTHPPPATPRPPFPDDLPGLTTRALGGFPGEQPHGTSRGPTKTVRFPAGSDLPAWYEHHAAATGISANALMVLALDRFRAESNGAAATERETA